MHQAKKDLALPNFSKDFNIIKILVLKKFYKVLFYSNFNLENLKAEPIPGKVLEESRDPQVKG